MMMLLTAVAFVVLLTVLILIHEFGHFMAARRAGVTVEEFGFGLPPKARTLFKRNGTVFTLNWIPFGGFVRLKGEAATTVSERNKLGSFHHASIAARIAILSAGVFMNFLLAFVLLVFGFSVGRWIPTYFEMSDMLEHSRQGIISLETGVVIEQVVSGEPAAIAGVPEKSVLLKVNDTPITLAEQVGQTQQGKRRVAYTVLVGEGADAKEQQYTVTLKDGKSGVVISTFPRKLSAPLRGVGISALLAFREARIMTEQTIIGIGTLIRSLAQSGRVPEGITGIVGIAQLTYSSVQAGFMTYLRLVALISLSLAILNFLPFPALDGGRLLFVLVEAVTRRPLNRRFEAYSNALGFSVLILLILLITFYDIVRLF
ncbi:MAG: M50 family metallopeptidase [Candidatus Peribacteraceae bacterium]|nr:M50 family metallopeptidase [Candidatus Peribacteraceae bacterium]MDD5742500.1 M50 family metallopeptidase [Candidatus Peribacteraceae bacterium]